VNERDIPLIVALLTELLKRDEVDFIHMEEKIVRKDWPLSVMCWYAVLIWFAASLFSQVLHIAKFGVPYNVDLLLDSIGPYAWIIIGIELSIWIMILVYCVIKIVKRFGIGVEKTPSRDLSAPQA
jgi:hypothetical protein